MKANEELPDPIEKQLADKLAKFQPPDEIAARRRLLEKYDREHALQKRPGWQVPAAAAAGLVLGVIAMSLLQQQPPASQHSVLQPMASHEDTQQNSPIRLLENNEIPPRAVSLDARLRELEHADSARWLEAIEGYLQAGDRDAARKLLEAYGKRVPTSEPPGQAG